MTFMNDFFLLINVWYFFIKIRWLTGCPTAPGSPWVPGAPRGPYGPFGPSPPIGPGRPAGASFGPGGVGATRSLDH